MDIDVAIKTRRSVRQFKQDPVSKELLEKVLESALWAPSYMDWQNWYYVILGGDEKDKIYRVLEDSFKKVITSLDDDASEDIRKRTRHFLEATNHAPNLIVVFSDVNFTETPEALFSVAASVQNLLLSAHSYGLGACWISSAVYVAEELCEVLGVLDKELMGVITIGYPLEVPEPTPRKPGRVVWADVDG